MLPQPTYLSKLSSLLLQQWSSLFAFQETDAILDTGMEPASASKLKLSFIGGVGFSFPAG